MALSDGAGWWPNPSEAIWLSGSAGLALCNAQLRAQLHSGIFAVTAGVHGHGPILVVPDWRQVLGACLPCRGIGVAVVDGPAVDVGAAIVEAFFHGDLLSAHLGIRLVCGLVGPSGPWDGAGWCRPNPSEADIRLSLLA